jgi:hypothetical protein
LPDGRQAAIVRDQKRSGAVYRVEIKGEGKACDKRSKWHSPWERNEWEVHNYKRGCVFDSNDANEEEKRAFSDLCAYLKDVLSGGPCNQNAIYSARPIRDQDYIFDCAQNHMTVGLRNLESGEICIALVEHVFVNLDGTANLQPLHTIKIIKSKETQ